MLRTYALACCMAITGCAAHSVTSERPDAESSDGATSLAHELHAHLSGTTWQWGGDDDRPISFGVDGFVAHRPWSERGLVTRWEAIDRRTVLLTITAGRDGDRYAILVFSEDLETYEGHNFHRGPRVARSARRGAGMSAGDRAQ